MIESLAKLLYDPEFFIKKGPQASLNFNISFMGMNIESIFHEALFQIDGTFTHLEKTPQQ